MTSALLVCGRFPKGIAAKRVSKGENDVMNNGLATMNKQVTATVHQVKVAVSEVAAGSEQLLGHRKA